MKAIRMGQYGGPDVLKLVSDAPKPVAGNGQVLIQVLAASLNPIDWKIRQGYLKDDLSLTLPAILGGDFVGRVVQHTDSGLKAGDQVYGYASPLAGGSGSFGEYCAVNASNVTHAPQNVTTQAAAALPLVGASALQSLEEHLKLQRGQKILIHGGGGGIGSLAIQFAKVIGAYVATTVRGDDLVYARALGADEIIDYTAQSFETMLKNYDAVLDTVGGSTTAQSFQVLKRGGALVSMLGQPDEVLAKRHGVVAIGQLTRVTTDILNRLKDLTNTKKLKVRIAKTFSMDQYRQAFDLAEHGRAKGKVVLDYSL